jgi:hypothetical protein
MSYVFAGSVIGGAVGYFFLTDSGRQTVQSIREFDFNKIPDKLSELRGTVERGGRQISDRVEAARHRVLNSFEAGREAYTSHDVELDAQLRRMEDMNNHIAGGIHHAIDELNKTVYQFEKTVLGSAYEIRSLVRAIRKGVDSLRSGPSLLDAPRATGFR